MGNFTATVCRHTPTIATDEWSKQLIPQEGGEGVGKGKDAENKQRTWTQKVMKSIPNLSVSLFGPLTVLQSVFEKVTFTGQVNDKHLLRFSLGKMGGGWFHPTAFNFMEISSDAFWRIHLC